MEPQLCRKDVCRIYGFERTTLWRMEREGLRFINGRIAESRLVWWMERRDAARILGMKVRVFLEHPREVQNALLAAALKRRELGGQADE